VKHNTKRSVCPECGGDVVTTSLAYPCTSQCMRCGAKNITFMWFTDANGEEKCSVTSTRIVPAHRVRK